MSVRNVNKHHTPITMLTFIVGGDVGETDGRLDGFNVGALVAVEPVKRESGR